MSKKEISQELYEAIMEQSLVSAKIASIIKKEEKKDFWSLLDMEIDRVSNEIKWDISMDAYGRFDDLKFRFNIFERNLELEFTDYLTRRIIGMYGFSMPHSPYSFDFTNPHRKRLI